MDDLAHEIRALRGEMREGFQGLRTELHGDIGSLRSEMHADVRSLWSEMVVGRRYLFGLWATTVLGFAAVIVQVGLR